MEVEPDCGRLGIPDARVALDGDRVAVPQDEELPERRRAAECVDYDGITGL